nr:MAG TPA: hypothetical protein [Bacteriophage sp.]
MSNGIFNGTLILCSHKARNIDVFMQISNLFLDINKLNMLETKATYRRVGATFFCIIENCRLLSNEISFFYYVQNLIKNLYYHPKVVNYFKESFLPRDMILDLFSIRVCGKFLNISASYLERVSYSIRLIDGEPETAKKEEQVIPFAEEANAFLFDKTFFDFKTFYGIENFLTILLTTKYHNAIGDIMSLAIESELKNFKKTYPLLCNIFASNDIELKHDMYSIAIDIFYPYVKAKYGDTFDFMNNQIALERNNDKLFLNNVFINISLNDLFSEIEKRIFKYLKKRIEK